MKAWKSAVAASLALLVPFLSVSPSFAASQLAECSRWSASSLADYAHAADLKFNRGRQGEPFLPGLTKAVWLIRHERWSDAGYLLIGFDHPFWLIPGQGGKHVPAIVGQITTVLHQCSVVLGPDYSMRPIPAMTRGESPSLQQKTSLQVPINAH